MHDDDDDDDCDGVDVRAQLAHTVAAAVSVWVTNEQRLLISFACE